MKNLARLALVVTLLVTYFPPARASAATKLPKASVEAWFNGAAGYARAVKLQRELNLPLVVYFYTDRCPDCRVLDNKYLPSVSVQDYLRGVVKVRINPGHGRAELALSKSYGIKSYPSFFVMRRPATRPVSVHPFRKAGNLTPMQFANACRAVAPIALTNAAVRSSGVSGKFRERPGTVTTVSISKGGGQIVTVVPPSPPKKVVSRKQ